VGEGGTWGEALEQIAVLVSEMRVRMSGEVAANFPELEQAVTATQTALPRYPIFG
jgi:hypothetical protein